jgi:hypothetical protein
MKVRLFTLSILIGLVPVVSLGLLLISAGAGPEPARRPAETRVNNQQRRDNVGPISQVDSQTHAIAVQGTHVYVGVGRRLAVLDVTDPADPRLVGQTGVLPAVVQDIDVAGEYAYVAAGEAGLLIIDVSDPAQPKTVGAYAPPGSAGSVYVSGNRVYVAAGEAGLRIVDVSNPRLPVELGVYAAPEGVNDAFVSGRYAHLATGAGLRVVDVTDPTAPLEVASYGTSGEARQIYVAGRYAYLLVSRGSRWQQHNPPAPDVSGMATPAPAPSATPSPNDSLWVIDISDPAAPAKAGTYDSLYEAAAIQVAGRLAYVATTGYIGGLRVIDVSNVAQPHEVGTYGQAGGIQDLYIVDNIAYMVARTKVHTVDVSDPSRPVELGAYARWWFARDVQVVNSYAYLADSRFGLRVVDVSDPRRPVEIGSYAVPDVVQGVDVADGPSTGSGRRYAYIAASEHGLRVVDVSNPHAPVEVGIYDTPGDALDVYLAGGYAYVADGEAGLRVVDVSNPDMPFEVGATVVPGLAQGVHVAGGYAYVAAGATGLHVIDVSDPGAPQAVANCQTPGPARDVNVAGHYAYVAGEAGLHVIDVSDPLAPEEIGTYDRFGPAHRVHVAGPFAYVAAGDSSLYVLDVVAPATPWQQGFYGETPGDISGVYAAAPYVYVADSQAGLLILQFASAAAVTISPIGPPYLYALEAGPIRYSFPSHIFTDTVTIVHTGGLRNALPMPPSLAGIGFFFDLHAVYSDTGQPAQPIWPYRMSVRYWPSAVSPIIDDSTLALYYWDGAQWVREPTSIVDAVSDEVWARPDRFGRWAVLGETGRMAHNVRLPVVMVRYDPLATVEINGHVKRYSSEPPGWEGIADVVIDVTIYRHRPGSRTVTWLHLEPVTDENGYYEFRVRAPRGYHMSIVPRPLEGIGWPSYDSVSLSITGDMSRTFDSWEGSVVP